MPDTMLITCCDHTRPLEPVPSDESVLACPVPLCATAIRITPLRASSLPGSPMPSSPLTSPEMEAITRNEFVCTHQKVGFSRAEAMQLLCAVMSAAVMKGPPGA